MKKLFVASLVTLGLVTMASAQTVAPGAEPALAVDEVDAVALDELAGRYPPARGADAVVGGEP